ncbi:hypothetical protein BE21_56505 [Sorangium cellulosum]|uniref:Uncharacterized protein n=1 Tax=Sorangium cellulosum TaxID=56 RepID=A0A150T9X9_SORCE|nr:hypothetical protein BE21_56505 [Sorangium cellulosum]
MKDNISSPLDTLAEIKHLMERSSRFISLSGLSGVFAGAYALAGAFAAFRYLDARGIISSDNRAYTITTDDLIFFGADAAIVLILAIATGVFLTTRKAKQDGNSIFDASAKKLIINLCIPLFTGGLFCLALVLHGPAFYIAPAMLIFYGLSLINASKYTLSDVRFLGIAEVALGIISAFIIGYGLIFWAIGFGVLHIIYGTYMYFKYER